MRFASQTRHGSGSIFPLLRLDVGDLVGHGVGVDGAVVDAHGAGVEVGPGQRVLHPVDVVALLVVLARVRAAAFLAVGGADHRGGGLHDQVLVFHRLDQVGVPDQRTVGDGDVVRALPDVGDL